MSLFMLLCLMKYHFIEEENKNNYTKFEQLLIASIQDALQNRHINPADKKTLLIISTTKGNISLLETEHVQ